MGIVNVLIALAIGVVIWRVSVWAIRLLTTPPPEISPEEVVEVEQHYLCTLCGAEVVMTVQNVQDASPPKHCREEMEPVRITGM